VTVVTGRAARRKIHLRFVALTVICLSLTIYYAKQLGQLYHLERLGWIHDFHLLISRVTSASYLVVIGSGLATLKRASRRKTHSRIAYSVLTLTVVTAVTGVWMIFSATPK